MAGRPGCLAEVRCSAARPDAGFKAQACRETRRLPIVFVMIVDPPGRGFVDTLARPGRNLTGLTHFEPAMGGKWLELLKEVAPGTRRVAFLYNPDSARRGAGSAVYVQSFEKFAATLAVRPVMMPVRNAAELGQALEAFGGAPSGALLVPPDAFNTNHRTAIVQGTSVTVWPPSSPIATTQRTGD